MRTAWRVLRLTVEGWIADDAPAMGAALAYYTVFSMAPLLLIVTAVAGMVFGEEAARGEIVRHLAGLVGPATAQTLEAVTLSLARPGQGMLAAAVGVATLLIGATTVFAELESALNRIWKAPSARPVNSLWGWLRVRLLSLGMVLAMGFLLVVSLIVTAALSAFARWWGAYFGEYVFVARLLDIALSFAMVTMVFAIIYKWMPRVRLAWRDVLLGAAATALLFTLGKFVVGVYIGHSAIASAFGAAASLVVLLLWVYYSAQIFLLGAEFTWVFTQMRRKPAQLAGASLAEKAA